MTDTTKDYDNGYRDGFRDAIWEMGMEEAAMLCDMEAETASAIERDDQAAAMRHCARRIRQASADA